MKAPRIVEIVMIPFFLWLTFYFWSKSKEKDLTHQEILLWGFAITGFFTNIYFAFVWQEL